MLVLFMCILQTINKVPTLETMYFCYLVAVVSFVMFFVQDIHLLSLVAFRYIISKKISNDQELIQSDPTSCPQNQKGNN